MADKIRLPFSMIYIQAPLKLLLESPTYLYLFRMAILNFRFSEIRHKFGSHHNATAGQMGWSVHMTSKPVSSIVRWISPWSLLHPVFARLSVAAMGAVWSSGFWPGLQHECDGIEEGWQFIFGKYAYAGDKFFLDSHNAFIPLHFIHIGLMHN